MFKLLGVSGFARSGKDTFVSFVQELLKEKGIVCPRIAFADELKRRMNSFLSGSMGISAHTQNPEEKAIIRPLLVGYGEGMRKLNVNHWIDVIKPNIEGCIQHKEFPILPIISDVRYENEAKFVKDMGGAVVVVNREGVYAPNEEEKLNQPLVEAMADAVLNNKNYSKEELSELKAKVKEVLERLKII